MPSHKTEDKSMLTQAAESIGKTLGAIAAKASELPEAFSHSEPVRAAKRRLKKATTKAKVIRKTVKRKLKVKAKGKKKSAVKAKARGKKKSQRRRS